ncbi:hypothetical protein EV284_5079 [Streptomyces sp. BK022]|uniref:DUF7144 family membrane protein n=1 Tax=Streptomyces sp. BK022 TaxID=2512123 RepID=UPI00102A3D67|nr:hypothetical protein [Streptomyces sp. BK022]RZU30123.1 hypothetical protein EV284_5079 [Streptomyces sp. BK022]
MTQQTQSARSEHNGLAEGGAVFAGVLMLVNGILHIFQGISAIALDDVYARINAYVYKIDLTGWGWILLVAGVIVVATGAGVLMGASWARVVGIVITSLGLILQFLFLPYSPIWSLILIALDFFIIWALATWHPEGRAVV